MKNTFIATAFFASVLSLFAAAPAHAEGDASNGEKLYPTKCGTCHSLDNNKIGPMQRGVYGRKAGTAVGYKDYSPALVASGITWDENTLEKWLTNPSGLVAGTKMSFMLPSPKERADIIAYLKSVPPKK